jgi:hypothetical protein
MVTPDISRVANALRTVAGRWRRAHVHMLVRSRDGGAGVGVVGSPHVRPHYARVFLGDSDGATTTTRVHLGGCERAATTLAKRFGLAVVSEVAIPPAFEARLLRVARFVSLVLDIGESNEAYLARLPFSARDDLRRIRKNGLRCEISREPSWAQEFFERYHRPSVTGRHGEEGFVMSADGLARIVREHAGEVLRVMQGDTCIAALLAHPENGGYRMGRLGWLGADPARMKAGALGAIYWFSALRARELGFSKVIQGGTPPYLEDGVFRFKAKWDPALEPGVSFGAENHLLLAPEHPHARRLLEGRSMLVHGRDGKFFVLSCGSCVDAKLSAGIAGAISHWFRWRRDGELVAPGANAALPEALRPWFIEEPVSTGAAGATGFG